MTTVIMNDVAQNSASKTVPETKTQSTAKKRDGAESYYYEPESIEN